MTYWNLEAQAEADLRYPPDHEVEDPFGETGVARSDEYGYDEMANRAFMQGVEWQASRKDASHDAEVARKALTDAADFISTPGVLWHGDDGVTVYADGAYGGNRMKLTDWLRLNATEEKP